MFFNYHSRTLLISMDELCVELQNCSDRFIPVSGKNRPTAGLHLMEHYLPGSSHSGIRAFPGEQLTLICPFRSIKMLYNANPRLGFDKHHNITSNVCLYAAAQMPQARLCNDICGSGEEGSQGDENPAEEEGN
jgi:hypothetical protein